MNDGGGSPAMPPKLGEESRTGGRSGTLGRLGLLVFALAFQILTAVALFIFVHVLRGHYEDSTYSTGQQIDAAVIGLPGVALGIGVLLLAVYNVFDGRRSGLVLRLALAAAALLAVAYGIELALK
jgi:hypothetical protein